MSTTSLVRKLLIKPGNRVLAINPPEEYAELLGELPQDARLVGPDDAPVEVVHLFVTTTAELAECAVGTVPLVIPGGILWISYPKKTSGCSDLSRETLQSALTASDQRPVTQIAVDEVWSAMRFRPESDVKSTGV